MDRVEVTYKNGLQSLESLIPKLRQEMSLQQSNSAKKSLTRYLMNGSSPVLVNFLVCWQAFP